MHRVDPVVLTDVLSAHGKYRGLRYPQWEKARWCVDAVIEIDGEDGERWGAFDVRVILPRSYPIGLPALFEVGGRIKQDANWHINEDGSCCTGPYAAEMSKYGGRAVLLDWLDGSAHPFLANHLYKERFGRYRSGEYSHGIPGIVEYYQELWPTDLPGIIHRLRQVVKLEHLSSSSPCFCGSGLRYAKCHATHSDFAGLPRSFYKKDLALLQAYDQYLKSNPIAA